MIKAKRMHRMNEGMTIDLHLFIQNINKKIALCILLFLFCFSCSFSSKEEAGEQGSSVIVSKSRVSSKGPDHYSGNKEWRVGMARHSYPAW